MWIFPPKFWFVGGGGSGDPPGGFGISVGEKYSAHPLHTRTPSVDSKPKEKEKRSGAGSFPRTKQEVLGGTKIPLFEFWGQIFEFWRHIFEFWHHFFDLWRHIFVFWRQKNDKVFLKGVGGGWVGPPGPPGGLDIGVGKKYSAHPLAQGLRPKLIRCLKNKKCENEERKISPWSAYFAPANASTSPFPHWMRTPKCQALRHRRTRRTVDGWRQKNMRQNRISDLRAEPKMLNPAANFAGTLQGFS